MKNLRLLLIYAQYTIILNKGNCSCGPPMVMVGIVPSRYSYDMIKESECFVVNIPEKSYQEVFDYLGSVSKRDADKLKEKNVRLEDGKIDFSRISFI